MIMKEEKNFGSEGKILRKFQYFKKIFLKMFKFLTDTLAKILKNISAYSFYQNILIISFLF